MRAALHVFGEGLGLVERRLGAGALQVGIPCVTLTV